MVVQSGRLQRGDFLRLRHRGVMARAPAFMLQAFDRCETPPGPARIGFTITKRVGNAVERNRIRRRLREAIRNLDRQRQRPGHDYALIARRDVLTRSFARLKHDLDRAFHNVHKALGGEHGKRTHAAARGPNDALRQAPMRDGCS